MMMLQEPRAKSLNKPSIRRKAKTPANVVEQALDALALALVEHRHTWTARERKLYEDAVASLKAKG